MKKLLIATAVATIASQANAAAVAITGTGFTGTYDADTNSLIVDFADYIVPTAPGNAFLVTGQQYTADTTVIDDITGAPVDGTFAGTNITTGGFLTCITVPDNTPGGGFCGQYGLDDQPAGATFLTGFDSVANTFTSAGIGNGEWVETTYSFEVAAVPVPAAAWLFGSALVGLAGVGRKRK